MTEEQETFRSPFRDKNELICIDSKFFLLTDIRAFSYDGDDWEFDGYSWLFSNFIDGYFNVKRDDVVLFHIDSLPNDGESLSKIWLQHFDRRFIYSLETKKFYLGWENSGDEEIICDNEGKQIVSRIVFYPVKDELQDFLKEVVFGLSK